MSQDDKSDELALLQKRVDSDPGNLEYLLELGDAFALKAHWNEAIEVYKKATKLDPENADIQNDIGTIYEEAGEAELAENAYLHALRLQPDHSTAYLNLGILYKKQERFPEALEALEKCIDVTTSTLERTEAQKIIKEIMAQNAEAFPPIRWVQAAETNGLMLAEMMADRLRGQGIKAVAWQEGAGNAMGLSVGILGTGRVMVPKENLEEAKSLLEMDANVELETPDEDSLIDESDWFESENDSWVETLEKAALGLVAFTISPIGAAIAFIVSRLSGGEKNIALKDEVICPYCHAELEIDDKEMRQGWFVCPECDETVDYE